MEKISHHPILIIGAGVLGLTTSIRLQERFPNLASRITIVAQELPSLPRTWNTSPTVLETNDQTPKPSADYASMWAGAHYRPIPRSTRQLEEEFDLAVRTSEVMNQIAREYDESVSGVAVMPAVELLEKIPEGTDKAVSALKSGDVYAGVGDEFKVLKGEELKRYDIVGEEGKLSWGCEYMSYCVNVHLFCCWLLEIFVSNGGKVVKKKLNRVDEAFNLADSIGLKVGAAMSEAMSRVVINTSGRNFDMDPKTKIIRGQTVLVRNEYGRTITRQMSDGNWCFLIPRPGGGGTVVGGTKEIGDEEVEARSLTRRTLLENAVKCFPDFVATIDDFEVVMDNVGRRPWRESGLRIEAEDVSPSPTDRKMILHGYGAGGRGYELSWGVAEKIVDLADGHFQQLKV